MSLLQYPDVFKALELYIWDNAAFDNGKSDDSSAIKGSWCNVKAFQANSSLESDGSKEIRSPISLKSAVSLKSIVSFQPLHTNNGVVESTPAKSKLVGGKAACIILFNCKISTQLLLPFALYFCKSRVRIKEFRGSFRFQFCKISLWFLIIPFPP